MISTGSPGVSLSSINRITLAKKATGIITTTRRFGPYLPRRPVAGMRIRRHSAFLAIVSSQGISSAVDEWRGVLLPRGLRSPKGPLWGNIHRQLQGWLITLAAWLFLRPAFA